MPNSSIPNPPINPNDHVPSAKVVIPLLGIILLKPQNVSGPPPAAVNNSAAAGAVPIPNKISSATSGISNKSGTFINIPTVDAIRIPITSLPRNLVTIDGLSH